MALGSCIEFEMIMNRLWTVIGVHDVAASLNWYQTLLGLPEKPANHDYFGQVQDTDGRRCFPCTHAHEHPTLTSPALARPGNGLLLFFLAHEFDSAPARARMLVPRLEEEPRLNENTGALEFAVKDPDGYYVMVSAYAADAVSG